MFPEHKFSGEDIQKRYENFYGDDRIFAAGWIPSLREKLSNLSEFVREIKVGFSRYYNRRHNRVIDNDIVEHERKKNYEISRTDRFRYRTRYFTDSGIIGTKEFISCNYQRFKGVFMSKKDKIPKPVDGLDGVYSLKRKEGGHPIYSYGNHWENGVDKHKTFYLILLPPKSVYLKKDPSR